MSSILNSNFLNSYHIRLVKMPIGNIWAFLRKKHKTKSRVKKFFCDKNEIKFKKIKILLKTYYFCSFNLSCDETCFVACIFIKLLSVFVPIDKIILKYIYRILRQRTRKW